jgi:predicted transcriptional regulator
MNTPTRGETDMLSKFFSIFRGKRKNSIKNNTPPTPKKITSVSAEVFSQVIADLIEGYEKYKELFESSEHALEQVYNDFYGSIVHHTLHQVYSKEELNDLYFLANTFNEKSETFRNLGLENVANILSINFASLTNLISFLDWAYLNKDNPEINRREFKEEIEQFKQDLEEVKNELLQNYKELKPLLPTTMTFLHEGGMLVIKRLNSLVQELEQNL